MQRAAVGEPSTGSICGGRENRPDGVSTSRDHVWGVLEGEFWNIWLIRNALYHITGTSLWAGNDRYFSYNSQTSQDFWFPVEHLQSLSSISYSRLYARMASVIPLPLSMLLGSTEEKENVFSFYLSRFLEICNKRKINKKNSSLLTCISHRCMGETQGWVIKGEAWT